MFNNPKDSSYSFFKDDEEKQPGASADDQSVRDAAPAEEGPVFSSSNFLGMTAVQRFVIALMFLMMVCILGTMFLLVTGSLYLPL